MILEFNINDKTFESVGETFLNAWNSDEKKVFVLKSNKSGENIRNFYESFCSSFGKIHNLAEDIKIGNRDNQRSNKIWMEVRFDPSVKDAYRHSSSNQPLHTDGSYIPSFPNATLMCCVANSQNGGETIFISANDIVQSLIKEDKKLLDELLSEDLVHERSGDQRTEKVIVKLDENKYLVNFNYYCVSKNNNEEKLKMAKNFFDYLGSSNEIKKRIKEVKLAPGEAVAWKDRELLHGRNSFIASENSQRFLWKCAVNLGK
jgi:alpha-ketoglutarate-dependent taurine dioxygenase